MRTFCKHEGLATHEGTLQELWTASLNWECTNLLVLRKQPSHALPDTPGTPLQGEPEDGVGPPASILLVVDYIPDGAVHIYSGHTLTQPFTLHLLGGNCPYLQAGGDGILAGRWALCCSNGVVTGSCRCGGKLVLWREDGIATGRMAVWVAWSRQVQGPGERLFAELGFLP